MHQLISDEFRKSPTRLMTHVLDTGVIPSGITSQEQLDKKELKRKLDSKLQEELIAHPGIVTDMRVLINGLNERRNTNLYNHGLPLKRVPGLDNCFDCNLEISIWKE